MSLLGRIAKKIRRRFRRKGTLWQSPMGYKSAADDLIANNWGITFSNRPAEEKGSNFAWARLQNKLKANKRIPYFDRPESRQVRRSEDRLHMKKVHSQMKAKKAKDSKYHSYA